MKLLVAFVKGLALFGLFCLLLPAYLLAAFTMVGGDGRIMRWFDETVGACFDSTAGDAE